MATPSLNSIQSVGVIGAGQMGSGIAYVCALAGYDVTIADLNETVLQKAITSIDNNMGRQVARGRVSEEDKAAALKRINVGTEYKLFNRCDFVIEAATEREEIKRDIFKKLVPCLKPEAIIATNTSSISITRLAATTDRPEHFIGMHFMNPVPVMTLVELIRGIATDETTVQTVRELAVELGKP